MRINRTLFFICLFMCLLSLKSKATHIRAGEIQAQRTSLISFKYDFTLILYVTTVGQQIADSASVYCTDGWFSPRVKYFESVNLGNNVTRLKYKFSHTFASGGTYKVQYQDYNRVAGILNMTNSGVTPFYIETLIVIDPLIGQNNSPELTGPPIDDGSTGQIYFHNPGAYDPDGDSLSYSLDICLQAENTPVTNYESPGLTKFSAGGNFITINQSNGTMEWNYPDVCGVYNIAYRVYEWRFIPAEGKYAQIGFVHRDMQVFIACNTNQKPLINTFDKICIVAGDTLRYIVTATDPDGDNVELSAYGGTFEGVNPATFTTTPGSPAVGMIEWKTNCSNVRNFPNQAVIKADDKPSRNPSLVDIKSVDIQVLGQKPTGLLLVKNDANSTVTLTWNAYNCGNADRIVIWRKKCPADSFSLTCFSNDLYNYGYERVGEVSSSFSSFIDNNNGNGLNKGINYCYRIVAEYPAPNGGYSLPSEEACVSFGYDSPFMLNVSVLKTDSLNGKIFVRWRNRIVGSKASTFNLYRADGDSPTMFNQISISNPITDTFYIDSGLNTLNKQYFYYVQIPNEQESDDASSVWLEGVGASQEVDLNWSAFVPWSISDGNYHLVYRKYVSKGENTFTLIDSVLVNSDAEMMYIDSGQFNNIELVDGDSICYFIQTKGTYCNSDFSYDNVLINNSQEVCIIPQDKTGPCAPILTITSNCKQDLPGSNLLSWLKITAPFPCDNDIESYEIFYKPTYNSVYSKIGETIDSFFYHNNLYSFSGCYKVRAVDVNKNVGIFSNEQCSNDCPEFNLPNVITPNNDGINDFFVPIPPSRAVKKIDFYVYNRWGMELVKATFEVQNGMPNNEILRWDGTDDKGNKLLDGVYLYMAKVTFYQVSDEPLEKEYKGWVQIIR